MQMPVCFLSTCWLHGSSSLGSLTWTLWGRQTNKSNHRWGDSVNAVARHVTRSAVLGSSALELRFLLQCTHTLRIITPSFITPSLLNLQLGIHRGVQLSEYPIGSPRSTAALTGPGEPPEECEQ